MQYLLSEAEFQQLQRDAAKGRGMPADKELQEICTKVADTMPVLWGWSKDEKPKPWGCIYSKPAEWYCDSCPVRKICPSIEKHWSK